MEDFTRSGFTAATITQAAKRQNSFILALLLTSILYFGLRPTQPTHNVVAAGSVQTNVSIPEPIANAVVRDLSKQSGLPASAFRIVQAKNLTWLDRCLSLNNSGGSCKPIPVSGWQVTVTSGSKFWFYRTDAFGSLVKLEKHNP